MGAGAPRRRTPIYATGTLWLAAAGAVVVLFWAWPRATPPPGRGLGAARLGADTPLRRHGPVTKYGPVVGLTQLSQLYAGHDSPDPNLAAALYYPPDWRAARLAGQRRPPPGRLCAVMWNDAFKVIFVKNVKAAGSTIVTYFKDCAVMGPRDGPFAYRCLQTLNFGNATQVAHLMRVWDDYFVFAFGRNVLARSVSQYRYLTSFMRPACAPPWGEYCRDPYLLGDICERDAGKGACCDPLATSVHQYLHAMPQAPCLVTEQGQTAVDFIGRVEEFEDDFAALLAALNARPGVAQLPPPGEEMASINIKSRCGDDEAAGAAGGDGGGGGAGGGGGGGGKAGGRRHKARQGGGAAACDHEALYGGEHARCHGAVLSFYEEDVRLLMPAESLATS